MIQIKRIYEPYSKTDGYRILVDRLWPRGLKKEDVKIDKWLKSVAPSNALRKWFNHEPKKWKQFIERYSEEIRDTPPLREIQSDILKHRNVTLLFSAKDEQHNQAKALLEILISR